MFVASDPRCKLDSINAHVDDRKDRMENWELLLKNINTFYQARCLACHDVLCSLLTVNVSLLMCE